MKEFAHTMNTFFHAMFHFMLQLHETVVLRYMLWLKIVSSCSIYQQNKTVSYLCSIYKIEIWDIQLAQSFLRIRMHALNRLGCINLQNLCGHHQEEVLRFPKHPLLAQFDESEAKLWCSKEGFLLFSRPILIRKRSSWGFQNTPNL